MAPTTALYQEALLGVLALFSLNTSSQEVCLLPSRHCHLFQNYFSAQYYN